MPDTREFTAEEQLDDWLESTLDEIGDEPADQDHADRLLWALRSLRRRRAEMDAVVAARMEQLRTYQRAQTDQFEAGEQRLEGLLAGWGLAEQERTGRKTFKLPAGEVRVRARRERTEVDARMTPDDATDAVKSLIMPGAFRQDVVKVTTKMLPGTVKEYVDPGDVIPDYPGVPEGYEAREAVGTFDFGGGEPRVMVVPGVVLMIPKAGRDGLAVQVVTS